MDLSALAQRIAATKGISLDDATQQLEDWLADPNNTWTDEADILAAFGITSQGEPTMATDPAVQQVLDQNALLAQANYDLVKMLEAVANGGTIDPQVLADAKTNVNALNPGKFTF